MKYLILRLIKFYQKFISPMLGKKCRFYPTCSAYTYEAIEEYGVFKGLYLGIKRISKCHPFNEGGYDPLPKKKMKIIRRLNEIYLWIITRFYKFFTKFS